MNTGHCNITFSSTNPDQKKKKKYVVISCIFNHLHIITSYEVHTVICLWLITTTSIQKTLNLKEIFSSYYIHYDVCNRFKVFTLLCYLSLKNYDSFNNYILSVLL